MCSIKIIISIFCATIFYQTINCVPLSNKTNDRDTQFLINKIRKSMNATQQKIHNDDKKDDVKTKSNENVVRYNSKGESIENQKSKVKAAGGCKPGSSMEEIEIGTPPPVKEIKHHKDELHKDKKHHGNIHHNDNKVDVKSSSVEAHAMRFDRNGNTLEEYKDTEEHHGNHLSEEAPKKKKKKQKKVNLGDDDDKHHNINNILNEKIVNKQLQIRDLANEDDDDEEEEDDIPLITIPMVDILKKYQRMAQGFVSSTEEYSEETEGTNHLHDQHLKDILHEISMERKRAKHEKTDGKKLKPAALRVIEKKLSGSAEDL